MTSDFRRINMAKGDQLINVDDIRCVARTIVAAEPDDPASWPQDYHGMSGHTSQVWRKWAPDRCRVTWKNDTQQVLMCPFGVMEQLLGAK